MPPEPKPVIDLPHPVLDPSQNVATKALRVPAEMVLQVASGLDDPAAIAARYGYTPEEFTALSSWTPFVQEVAKVRAELEKSGFDFVLDSRLKAKELSNVIFLRALKDDATFGQVHDAFRTFTEFADLKPKPLASSLPGGAGSPPGFSISIVFKGEKPAQLPAIDITPTTVEEPPREVMGTRNPFVIEPA
jgi:hypothetical protein